ncbi:MAG: DUF3108 domain-containing protein [Parvibaculaceae bacterium]|nr:DUF3108 domain-containing protein [Parvibaculaceae bacterium]
MVQLMVSCTQFTKASAHAASRRTAALAMTLLFSLFTAAPLLAADQQTASVARTKVERGITTLNEAIELHAKTLGITSMDLSYRFFGGGMEVFSLDTQAILTPNTYEIASQIETRGIADSIFKGSLHTQARGLITKSGPYLHAYRQDYRGKSGEQRVFMVRDPKDTYAVMATPRNGVHAQPGFSYNSLKGTVDPLTASIYTALNTTKDPCEGKITIFDGRRVFNLRFTKDGSDDMDASRVGGYKGHVQRCKVVFKPIAGYARKWLIKEAKNPMKPFTVWIAEIKTPKSTVLNKPLLIPVKVLVETSYMNATAHLTQAIIDGDTLVDAKLR